MGLARWKCMYYSWKDEPGQTNATHPGSCIAPVFTNEMVSEPAANGVRGSFVQH